MNSKGQGISINVIVIAALALLVLVVLAIMFIGRLNDTGTQLNACENKGGQCMDVTLQNTCPNDLRQIFTGQCTAPQICCLLTK